MPPFRNPFVKKPPIVNGIPALQYENSSSPTTTATANEIERGSPRADYADSRASSSLSIKKREDPGEYKLSVVNDSGVYLPPSPPEKKSFWQRTTSSSSSHRSMLSDNEPFSISRESFESYRRSFDISARSPVYPYESTTPRQSLESRMANPARSAVRGSGQLERPRPTEEETFEDVGLNDETKQPPKKKGIFARFGESSESPTATDSTRPGSSHRGFHLPGRKRGQSGQGAELGHIIKSTSAGGANGVPTTMVNGTPQVITNGANHVERDDAVR